MFTFSVPRETPRLLINREKCGETDGLMTVLGLDRGLNFDSEKAYRLVCSSIVVIERVSSSRVNCATVKVYAIV